MRFDASTFHYIAKLPGGCCLSTHTYWAGAFDEAGNYYLLMDKGSPKQYYRFENLHTMAGFILASSALDWSAVAPFVTTDKNVGLDFVVLESNQASN